ncbi:TetR family transcriptional regulator [Roseibium sp. RKSG952]|uniref:TetR family transcriptional regulator n=1 Tax=Roseibium sp. RKSG952 TaxID=2529384 RepID=UPI0012BC8072|nr:TetR family transcriptional regulator [Roseibium sp. RKSG952]MTH95609.1 TetR/AcrR family transcriptional regulator [Roseibium sp. RKSG952]
MGLGSTPHRLLRAAEQLMAENGIAGTSVRQITDVAEANIASVNYYFGSKNALLLELLKDRFARLDAELLARVSSVVDKAAGEIPSIADLTDAYFDALAHLGYNTEAGQLDPFILLIQRVDSEQRDTLKQAQDFQAPGITRLLTLLSAPLGEEDRKAVDAWVLVGLMFTASVAAMPLMARDGSGNKQVLAIRGYIAAGVAAYIQHLRSDI